MEIPKISRRRPRSVDNAERGHFHVLVLQRTAKKCTKIYNARAQLLFCSLNLLFGDVLVAVVVVVCLSSLLSASSVTQLDFPRRRFVSVVETRERERRECGKNPGRIPLDLVPGLAAAETNKSLLNEIPQTDKRSYRYFTLSAVQMRDHIIMIRKSRGILALPNKVPSLIPALGYYAHFFVLVKHIYILL